MTMNRLKLALKYRSLFVFDSEHRLRKATSWLITNVYFESLIIALIIASSFLVGVQKTEAVKIVDLLLDCIFLLELLAKVVSYGLLLHPFSYARDAMNLLDATIVLTGFSASITTIATDSTGLGFTVLRLLRVFRPLRLLVAAKELRVVLQTIIQCSKALLHVAVFIFFLLMLFAIIGLELFNGKLHHACFETETNTWSSPLRVCSAEGDDECGDKAHCFGNWTGANHGISSFDNIGYSLFSVLQIITLEDWVLIYYQLSDALDSQWHSIYFVLLIFLGSYFSLDLLLGVLTNQYIKTKDVVARQQTASNKTFTRICKILKGYLIHWKKYGFKKANIFLCNPTNLQNDQKLEAVESGENTKSCSNDFEARNENGCSKAQKVVSKVAHSKFYFWYGLLAIVINTGFQVASNHENSAQTENYLDIVNTTFNTLFAVELVINVIGFGVQAMIEDKLKLFDALTILLSLSDVVYSKARGRRNSGISIIRSLTLIRAFRMTKFWPSLSAMYYSFVKSIKTIFSLLIVLVLILFIFALLGNQLFKDMNLSNGAESMTESFDTMGRSMLQVFILLTGEGWPAFTANIIHKFGNKSAAKKIIPVLYFISFIIIGNFLLLNIFLGIVIDHLTTQPEEDSAEFQESQETDQSQVANSHLQCGSNINKGSTLDRRSLKECTAKHDRKLSKEIAIDRYSATEHGSDQITTETNSFKECTIEHNSTVFKENIVGSYSTIEHDRKLNKSTKEEEHNLSKEITMKQDRSLINKSMMEHDSKFSMDGTIEQQSNLFNESTKEHETDKSTKENESDGSTKEQDNLSREIETERYSSESTIENDSDPFSEITIKNSSSLFKGSSVEHEKNHSESSIEQDNNHAKKSTIKEDANQRTINKDGSLFYESTIEYDSTGSTKEHQTNLPKETTIEHDHIFKKSTKEHDSNTYKESTTEDQGNLPKESTIENDGIIFVEDTKEQDSKESTKEHETNVPKESIIEHDKLLTIEHDKTITNKDNMGEYDKRDVSDIQIQLTMIPSNNGEDIRNYICKKEHEMFDAFNLSSSTVTIEPDSSFTNCTDEQTGSIFSDVTSMSAQPAVYGIPQHKSLFIFSPTNKFRVTLHRIATSVWFPNLCLGSIVISTLLLAFEDPLASDKTFAQGLRYCDYFFTGIFTIEIIVKMISFGLVLGHPACYLRDKLNVIDSVVVLLSLINILLHTLNINPPLHLRVLRVLRVFRGLKVSKDLQHVVNCLVSTLAKIFNYFLLYMLLLLIYAVIGVKLYAGKLKKTENGKVLADHADYNFNNVANAMMTLFSIGTLDNWIVDLQQILTQANDISMSVTVFFLVSFLLIMTFIMLNVFVGFVVMAFQVEKEQQDGFQILDQRGKACISLAFKIKPPSHDNGKTKFQEKAFRHLSSPLFEYLTFIFVLLNCVVMMSKHYKQNKLSSTIQEISNICFTAVFTIELLIKMFALSPKHFVHDNWCILDTLVVLGSWVDVVLLSFKINIYVNLSIFRIFRIIRLCQIINKRESLKQIMTTFFKSIRCVPSITFFIIMILFIYAILGMQLFGKIQFKEDGAINRHANFRDFPTALMILLRTTTLDNWRELMTACADVQTLNCADNPALNCGSRLSYPFFLTFVFISAFMITNLFLAVIMDNFMYLTLDPSLLYSHHIKEFARVWSDFDTNNMGRIHTSSLLPFLKRLPPPIGFGEMCPKRIIYKKLLCMNLIIDENDTVAFRELLLMLIGRCLGFHDNIEKIRKDILTLNRNVSPELLDKILPVGERQLNDAEKQFRVYCASSTIQFYFRIITSILKRERQAILHEKSESNDRDNRNLFLTQLNTNNHKPIGHSKQLRSLSDTNIQSIYLNTTLQKPDETESKTRSCPEMTNKQSTEAVCIASRATNNDEDSYHSALGPIQSKEQKLSCLALTETIA